MTTNETIKITLKGDENSKELLTSCKLILEKLRGINLYVDVISYSGIDLSFEISTATTKESFPIPDNIKHDPTQIAFHIRKLIADSTNKQPEKKNNSLKDQIKKFGRADTLA